MCRRRPARRSKRVPPSPRGPNVELTRELGLITAIACGVGSVIGSGVFKKPGLMAAQLGSPELLILVWIVAGFATLFGALSIAEISGMFRDPGGQYVYFNKGYNRFVGYLYGWATFIVIQTGSIASIAYVFADSLGYFVAFPRLSAGLGAVEHPHPLIGAMTPFKFLGLKLAHRRPDHVPHHDQLPGRQARQHHRGHLLDAQGRHHRRHHRAGLRPGARQSRESHPVRGRLRRRRRRVVLGLSDGHHGDGRSVLGLRRLDQRHLHVRRDQERPAHLAPGHGHRGHAPSSPSTSWSTSPTSTSSRSARWPASTTQAQASGGSYIVAIDVADGFLGKWGGAVDRHRHHDLDLRRGQRHDDDVGPDLFRDGPREALLPPSGRGPPPLPHAGQVPRCSRGPGPRSSS